MLLIDSFIDIRTLRDAHERRAYVAAWYYRRAHAELAEGLKVLWSIARQGRNYRDADYIRDLAEAGDVKLSVDENGTCQWEHDQPSEFVVWDYHIPDLAPQDYLVKLKMHHSKTKED